MTLLSPLKGVRTKQPERLAASATGETAVVWDVVSRKLIATLKHPSIDWAAVRDRPEVKIHRPMLAKIDKLAERGSVEVVAFSPNERLLLTRRFEDEGRIWDVNTGTEKCRRLFDNAGLPTTKPRDSALRAVTKEGVGIHVLVTRSLFGGSTPRRLLLRLLPVQSTSAPVRF